MRPSPLRHPLALLRQVIGTSQKELADVLGKSAATVQAIELRKLALSEDLAAKIENETGVSADWLLAGDVTRPIENSSGAIYLKDDYELARAKRSKPAAHIDEADMDMCHLVGLLNGERLGQVFAAAMRAKPSKFQVAMFLADRWLQEMEQKFGKPGDDYLEYRSRVTVSRSDAEGLIGQISGPIPRSASARGFCQWFAHSINSKSPLFLSNYRRSLAEKYGRAFADKVFDDVPARKGSTGKKRKKKAAESSKSPV
jgi:transcriptional regulator with XRE-family HTH domain